MERIVVYSGLEEISVQQFRNGKYVSTINKYNAKEHSVSIDGAYAVISKGKKKAAAYRADTIYWK